MIIAFALTMILWKDDTVQAAEVEEVEKIEKNPEEKKLFAKESIKMPLEGKIIPLSEVKDAAFSQEILGKGLAIEPSKGVVVSPIEGKVETVFPTKHAIGLVSDSGIHVLIHVGMDTVQLEGKYFETFVQAADRVIPGQKLLTFDMEQIKNAGYSLVTPVVIGNTAEYLDVVPTGLENTEEFLTIIR